MMKDLLRESDVVSIHAPLAEKTIRLVDGEKELSMMKLNAILINTAMGSILDEAALISFLRKGWRAGAGIDVFEEEPVFLDSPLLRMENMVLTPHLRSATGETIKYQAITVDP